MYTLAAAITRLFADYSCHKMLPLLSIPSLDMAVPKLNHYFLHHEVF